MNQLRITLKAEIHQKTTLCCQHFELLPRNQKINSNVEVQQLAKQSDAVQEKWPELADCKGVVFQHDMQSPTHFWSLINNYWN